MNGPGSQNEFAKSAGEMNIPMQLDNKDYGKKVKAVAKKVVVKSSGDGKFYGARTIMTKEHTSFIDHILAEGFTASQQQVAMTRLAQMTNSQGDVSLEELMNKEPVLSVGDDIPADAWAVKTVNIGTLFPSQDEVEAKWIQACLENKGRTQGRPKVVITDYPTIIDGHHRIAACILAGVTTIEVDITKWNMYDDESGTPQFTPMENTTYSFVDYLITEGDDLSALPDSVVAEIKSNLNAGAKDDTQKWKNALELLHTAYKVANVRRPTPDQKGAYKQYETLIQAAVKALVKHRGLDGDWRTSSLLVREAAEGPDAHIGKRRFFIEIPGEKAAELEGANLDEIIEQMGNKFRRHGAKVRVEERSKLGAILTVWVGDVKRDRVIIKEVS